MSGLRHQYRVRSHIDGPWSRWVNVDSYQWNALTESTTTQKRIV